MNYRINNKFYKKITQKKLLSSQNLCKIIFINIIISLITLNFSMFKLKIIQMNKKFKQIRKLKIIQMNKKFKQIRKLKIIQMNKIFKQISKLKIIQMNKIFKQIRNNSLNKQLMNNKNK